MHICMYAKHVYILVTGILPGEKAAMGDCIPVKIPVIPLFDLYPLLPVKIQAILPALTGQNTGHFTGIL